MHELLPPVANCRSCGALIRWVTSGRTGKRMPIDAEPSLSGNLRLKVLVGVVTALVVPAGPERSRLRSEDGAYISHHATCPDGRAWRR